MQYILSMFLSLFFNISGNFQAGQAGNILKKLCPKERKCLVKLMQDILRPYVPEYKGDVEKNNESILYIYMTCFGRMF